MRGQQRQFLRQLIAIILSLAAFCIGVLHNNLHAEEKLSLPPAQVHPLPPSLAQWTDPKGQGDYFDQVRAVKAGFLVWSHFPIQVYIAPPPQGTLIKPEVWQAAIAQAVQDWQPYLPLSIAPSEMGADIQISANPPKARSGQRVRSAETNYEIYVSDRKALAHRVTIYIRPNQSPQYITASARHELGHALGIWGHSLTASDVMYFSQVRNPPSISGRDVNTLKRIYQQPTLLGWPVTRILGRALEIRLE
jgi:predicted Zn-dependent protease